MDQSPVLQRDLARLAGVSRAAVSFALNGRPGVSDALRQRILTLAAVHGYRPNAMVAAHLAHVRRGTVRTYQATLGYLSFLDHGLARRQIAGARARAEQLGYRLDVFDLTGTHWSGQSLTRALVARSIPGVVVGEQPDQGCSVSLDWSRFAAATLGYSLADPPLPRACHAHFRGMSRVLAWLEERGVRRVGYVARPGDLLRAERLQLASFLEFAVSRGRRPVPVLSWSEADRSAVGPWALRHRVQAVVSAEHEVRADLARLSAPPRFVSLCLAPEDAGLDGVVQDQEAVAAAAVDLVVAQVHRNERGPPLRPPILLLEGHWQDASGSAHPARFSESARERGGDLAK